MSDLLLPSGTTRTVDVPGASIAVTDIADGPAVVLAHGWSERREMWAPVTHRLLDAGHRVVLYDQRGHGSSSGDDGFTIENLAGDLRAVLEACDVRDAVLAGHSMGGMAVLALAFHHPDVVAGRARRLVLVATGAAEIGRGRGGRAAARVLASPVLDRAMRARWGHRLTRRTFGDHPSAADMRLTRDMFVSCPGHVRGGWVRAMWHMDLRPCLPTITTPTLIVSGSRDTVTPPGLSRALEADIPGARLVSLAGLGHQVPLEAPDVVAGLLREADT